VKLLYALALVAVAGDLAAADPADDIPLPRPRPVPEAGALEITDAPPPPPSACRLALTADLAVAPSLPLMYGPGECGGPDLVKLEAVILPDKSRVTLTPAATLRCTMAQAFVHWVREEVAPAAAALGSPPKSIETFDSYECRGRNRIVGAKLSEHGRANALDVRIIKLANGKTMDLTDVHVDHDFREGLKKSVCARFTTVLGPGADAYHSNHVHVDLQERRGGYRMCQWDIRDPPPPPQQVASAIPLPRPRPDIDAPLPRPRPEIETHQRDSRSRKL